MQIRWILGIFMNIRHKEHGMKFKSLLLLICAASFCCIASAQKNKPDSAAVAKLLKELLTICRTVDFADPKTTELGTFYKAAPYIIYRGDDKKRNWKDFVNYNNAGEKMRVNEVCERINRTANQDTAYRIVRYFTETESEGTWHVLAVTYKKKGVEKKIAYAFLKIGNRFGLGDIDD